MVPISGTSNEGYAEVQALVESRGKRIVELENQISDMRRTEELLRIEVGWIASSGGR